MHSIISHKTAFDYYRHFRNIRFNILDKDLQTKHIDIPLFYDKYQMSDVKNVAENICNTFPYDVLSKDNKKVHKLNCLKIHKSNLKYPKNSFRKINELVYIVSPELLFLQLAGTLNFVDLLLAGFELCGNYALSNNKEEGLNTNVRALTIPDDILIYLKKINKINKLCKNISNAMKAIKLIKENSNSPQESRLYIFLCSPHYIGGYGISGIFLNRAVELSHEAKSMLPQHTIIPDLSNPKTKIAIEYDSSVYHEDPRQNQKDKMRINALLHDKWQVFSIVKSHTQNFEYMQKMALNILKNNKQPIRIRVQNFEIKSYELFKALYKRNNYL